MIFGLIILCAFPLLFAEIVIGPNQYEEKINITGSCPDGNNNGKDIYNRALAFAVQQCDLEVADVLLSSGADPNTNRDDVTPYTPYNPYPTGVYRGRYEYYQQQRTWGYRPPNSCTVLHKAAEMGEVPMIRLLLKFGATVERSCSLDGNLAMRPLHVASKNGNVKAVEILVEEGADMNADASTLVTPVFNGSTTGGTSTPLNFAIENGHLNVVQLLLQHGASVQRQNDTTSAGSLCLAARLGDAEMMQALVDAGASNEEICNVRNQPYYSQRKVPLLSHLASTGNAAGLDFFLRQGTNVNWFDKNHATLLHYAMESGNVTMVLFLLSKGAKHSPKDVDGNTPLHKAASKDFVGGIEALLKFGAKLNELNDEGKTAMDVARSSDAMHVVQLLEVKTIIG